MSDEPSSLDQQDESSRCHNRRRLLALGLHIGCSEFSPIGRPRHLWFPDGDKMVYEKIDYVPALLRLFEGIIDDISLHQDQYPGLESIQVAVDKYYISILLGGFAVPIVFHPTEQCYFQELKYGRFTHFTYKCDGEVFTEHSDLRDHAVKYVNLCSEKFCIETAYDTLKYQQEFGDRLSWIGKPKITPCKDRGKWTIFNFKPYFDMYGTNHIDCNLVSLIRKRLYDLSACRPYKIELNGSRVSIESFKHYCQMYIPSDAPSVFWKIDNSLEICVTRSRNNEFEQVSLANGILTMSGGPYVQNLSKQIVNRLKIQVAEEGKTRNLTPRILKRFLWLFVRMETGNSMFYDERLCTSIGKLTSECQIPVDVIDEVYYQIINANETQFDTHRDNYEKREGLPEITNLNDSILAGGDESLACTLILTEGESAMYFALAGLPVLPNRDYYGVYPLKGKLLNVRDANQFQIDSNIEIQNIVKILGLKKERSFNVEDLRYGRIMIMADQDHDGSHIKGLIINLFHCLWPKLLELPSFIVQFITPLIKTTGPSGIKVFYSIPEYESWKEKFSVDSSQYSIKYYKGLAVHTTSEAKEYFQEFENHMRVFVGLNEDDNHAIEVAFGKDKIKERKEWLSQHVSKTNPANATYIDPTNKFVTYCDFINKELIHFSIRDIQRNIPSVIDGLKIGQRKILYYCLHRELVHEIKVEELQGFVASLSSYTYGEENLGKTIIAMAQEFVGANNLNLLYPCGMFGSRKMGGKDHASPRYLTTRLTDITRYLFPKDDDAILRYLKEDSKIIEPSWYVPVIPMVLVNGSRGIGTGWSSYVPMYNPIEIIANIRRKLNGTNFFPMNPWYRNFKGTITKSSNVVGYVAKGVIEIVDISTRRISELPIGKWTMDYKTFLQKKISGENELYFKNFKECHDDRSVNFLVTLREDVLRASPKLLESVFKLTKVIGTSNMHLIGSDGVVKKYETPEEILEDFYEIRLQYYRKRKQECLDRLKSKVESRAEVPQDLFFKIAELENESPENMWLKDLVQLENALYTVDGYKREDQVLAGGDDVGGNDDVDVDVGHNVGGDDGVGAGGKDVEDDVGDGDDDGEDGGGDLDERKQGKRPRLNGDDNGDEKEKQRKWSSLLVFVLLNREYYGAYPLKGKLLNVRFAMQKGRVLMARISDMAE